MRMLKIIFLFALVQAISCLNYDQLARDECFKKVYVCGDYRMSVTGATGRLATEPHRFSEICRKHKEFIACVEQAAAEFCTNNLTNIARMALDNRRSLKLFCTNLEWKRNYFSSAKCINENEKAALDECIKEENEYEDDRPKWCLIPEPCDALERVFMCTVRKMKQLCGSAAAEVHRRMHILKMENRDVVCEIRRRNNMYCPKPPQTESVKRIGSLSVALSEAINNIFEEALVDTMDNFALILNEENISNLLDSDAFELRKSIFKAEIKEKFSPFFKNCKFPGVDLSRQPDLSKRSFNLLFRNVKKILSEASSNKLGSTFYDDILKSCGTENIALSSCLEKLDDLEALKSLNPMARISKELNAELTPLKDYILGLFELLSCNEDFLIDNIREDAAFITWNNMDSFPLQTLSCEWKEYEAFEKVFQCSLKFKPSDVTHENIQPDITAESTIAKSTIKIENVNEFLRPYILKSSLFTDSGSGMVDDFIQSTDSQEIAPEFSTTDTLDYEVDPYGIHRSGQQMVLLEEIDSEEVSNQESDIKMKSFDGSKGNTDDLPDKRDQQEHSMEEIFVDPPYSPTDSVLYLVMDVNSNTAKSYLYSPKNSTSTVNSESSESGVEVDTEKTTLEKENLRLQLRKIVSALDKRFANIEVKDFEFKEGSKSDADERLKLENLHYQSYPHHSSGINKSFQTDLNDFLKAKLNEYTEIYSMSSKSPVTENTVRGVRTRRRAVNERQNSKMDKSFSTESSNESTRPNSKFTNFKADL